MRLLGALLAGGQSQRFGADKAYARYAGKRLIDLVGSSLSTQCEDIVVCGREEPGFESLEDLPTSGIGPLGGINAALEFALGKGFDAVLSSACDVPNLPKNLANILSGEDAAIVEGQPVVGYWPVSVAAPLDEFIASGGRSMFAFADHIGARKIKLDPPLLNINQPQDLP